jgi:hypothetical protein
MGPKGRAWQNVFVVDVRATLKEPESYFQCDQREHHTTQGEQEALQWLVLARYNIVPD